MVLNPSGNGRVLVRLSAVPRDLRVEVADAIIRRGRLRGFDAAELLIFADRPVQNPSLLVPVDKADRVLRDGKLPRGSMPPVWNY